MYDLVVRHFLACVSRDAEGRETTIEIDVNSERVSIGFKPNCLLLSRLKDTIILFLPNQNAMLSTCKPHENMIRNMSTINIYEFCITIL